MALIYMHGKNANILWDAAKSAPRYEYPVTHAQNWTLAAEQDVAEITSMQDDWQSFVGGQIDWSATAECLLQKSGIQIPLATGGTVKGLGDVPAVLELYFIYRGSDYHCLYGDCLCIGATMSGEKDGIVSVTFRFQGSKGSNGLVWFANNAKPTYT